MSDIHTCEEYVLSKLHERELRIELLESENDKLKKELKRYTDIPENTNSDHDVVEERVNKYCLALGRLQFVKDCLSFFHSYALDSSGNEVPFDTWCWKNIDQTRIPVDVVNTTQFIVYMRKELASMYEDALNECRAQQ